MNKKVAGCGSVSARSAPGQRKSRLIQNGALAEKYLGCEGLSPEEFEKELQRIAKLSDVKKRKVKR